MELLIKGARIIDWSQNFIGDIYIYNGVICEVGGSLNKSCKTIKAEGLVIMPSFIDLHTHFRDPGFTYKEDIESGSKAAVRGGYTMVNLMANTNPICSSMETVNYVLDKGREIGLIDIHQVVSITNNFDGNDISHLDKLSSEVKMISEDGKDIMDSKVMLNAMLKAKEKGITVMCHCEEHSLSKIDTRLSENTMTWRNIALAQFTGCPAHIAHVSTKESMEYVIDAKKKGSKITCEVGPHHLALMDNDYAVNPPIRTREDVDYLIHAIKEGFVDAIGTDHAPHTFEDKRNGAPGISGIETSFAVCYTKLVRDGHISLNKLSEVMSKNPADILGIKKGELKVGYDGDMVLLNVEKEYEISSEDFKSKGKNTPFNGMKVYGKVLKTIKGGKVVFENEN